MGEGFALISSFFRWLKNFPLGLAIGSTAALMLAWAVDLEVSEAFSRYSVYLFSALTTLAAATLATSGVLMTVSIQADRIESERRAKLEAARSTLPLALSQLTEICDVNIKHNIKPAPDRNNEHILNDNSIATVKECIEFSNGRAQKTLQEVVMIYQIMTARQREDRVRQWLGDESLDKYDKYQRLTRIYQWASFRSVVECLFDFSRGRSDSVDRDSVVERFQKHVAWLSDEDGWMITNDPDIRELIENFKSAEKLAFNDPNWMDS